MKKKILYYIGVFAIVFALMSSIISPSLAIGSTPKSSDDGYEYNDDFYNAQPITVDYHPGLNASNEDWYYFDAVIGNTIYVDMYFSHSEGDLDLDLYDSSYSGLVGSVTVSNDEHVTWEATYSGSYYIRVYFETLGQLYDLDISLDPPVDDYMEDNDDLKIREKTDKLASAPRYGPTVLYCIIQLYIIIIKSI